MIMDITGLPGTGSTGTPSGAGEKLSAAAEGDLADERLREACQQLEGVFWHLLLRSMRKTIPGGGFLGQSSEERIYQDLLDEQYAMLLARQDKAGIGRILYEQLRRKG
ncbi:MAG: rod-binding protein [Bacillota bacterium]|nr:rod-binding protein [Bacillota bacterium]